MAADLEAVAAPVVAAGVTPVGVAAAVEVGIPVEVAGGQQEVGCLPVQGVVAALSAVGAGAQVLRVVVAVLAAGLAVEAESQVLALRALV